MSEASARYDRLKLRELRILHGGDRRPKAWPRPPGSLRSPSPPFQEPSPTWSIRLEVASLRPQRREASSRREYGRALLRRSVAVFDELKQGVQEIAYLSDPEAGELRIGSSASLSEGIVAGGRQPAVAQSTRRSSFMSCPAAHWRFVNHCESAASSLGLRGCPRRPPRMRCTPRYCSRSRSSWWRARRTHGFAVAGSSLPNW